MLSNYFKIALRTLLKNRLYTALNVGGLAIGLATCLSILLYVHDELSYDRFNAQAQRMVRVVFRANINGGQIKEPFAMPPVAQALRSDYPEVVDATRLRNSGGQVVQVGERIFRGQDLAHVDENFFRMFSLPLLKGDAQSALKEPNTIVISRKIAEQFFGAADPIGQELRMKGMNKNYRVTGVMENVPAKCHFHFDMFGSMAGLEEAKSTSWMSSEFYTYLLLPEGYEYKQLEAKMPQVLEKYMGPQFTAGLGMSLTEFKQKGNEIGLFLQPLTDIHLHSDFSFDLSPAGNVQYVYIFGAIALFMLLIACINFMNLSTAGAAKRAKEVGVRKALGSAKSGLVGQFLTESTLLTFVSLLLALALVRLSLPYLNELTDKQIAFQLLSSPLAIGGMIALGLIVGLLAGTYPAFFLSSFKPIAVLKGINPMKGGLANLRSGLVIFQFLISVSLILGTLVVQQQLAFIQNKKLGYEKDAVLILNNTGLLGDKEAVFREQLRQDPRIVSISCSGSRPVGPSLNNNTMVYPDEKQNQLTKTLRYSVDEDYIPTLGMKILSGRNFSREFATDSSAIVLNESAARAFGWGLDVVGHRLTRSVNNSPSISYQVIGVVEDFHFKSLHERISPVLMVLEPSSGLVLKTQTRDVQGLMSFIQTNWSKFQPDEPLESAFMDDMYQKTYVAEQKMSSIFGIFTGLTIFIACLGLFGLATFSAEQRSKEIGVRKVLGASVASIIALLARDFLKLVLIAIVIASPIAWYVMQHWLADFAYRIDIQWWMFAAAGLTAVGIAFLPVGYQSAKAALRNPVEVLKSE